MRIHSISIPEVLESLLTSSAGLTDEEAQKRLKEYGENEIREAIKKPLYLRFIAQFTHFLAILLWVAALLCFLSEYLNPGEGLAFLGIAILAVIFINAIFTFIQEYRAEKAIEELKKLLPFNVSVLRGGVEKTLPAAEIVPGDVIRLKEGDRVPADARVISSNTLTVNNAPLTGESESLPRTDTPFEGEYYESNNIVFAGTPVVSGSGMVVAYATGMATEFGKIAHMTGSVGEELSPLQKEIIRTTRVVAAIAMITGVFFFSLGFIMGHSFWDNFLFAIGIILANVPEGLLPTVTLSLAMASQRMAKKNALVKTLPAVETLGSVDVICTDKTGTLTQNTMEVKEVFATGDRNLLLSTALLCNNTSKKNGVITGNPTEKALFVHACRQIDAQGKRLLEMPFDSERKRMTVVTQIEDGIFAFVKGALENILPLCTHVSRQTFPDPMDESVKEEIMRSYHAMMDKGLRVLAFAHKKIASFDTGSKPDIESELTFSGLIGLEDPPRPEVADAIRKCRKAGIKIVMITGDAGRTAAAIAKQIGLVTKQAALLDGRGLETMPDSSLREFLQNEEVIFSRMTPRHKLRIVSVLQEEGYRVAVTGDGVNDAPALKKADIGIAMGITGTDVAKEAADIVLLDDNFATIINAIEEGRAIFANIKKFIIYILAHLTPEAIPYILFALFKIPLPITVMQILAIDLGTETIPALALGIEKPETDVMNQPPRRKDAGIIDKALLFRGYIFLGMTSAFCVLATYFYVLYSDGWTWGTLLDINHPLTHKASTATFLSIVLLQIGSIFVCRSTTETAQTRGFLSNRLIITGIMLEIVIAAIIIYLPVANTLFGTAPVGVTVWLIPFCFATAMVMADTVIKRARKQRSG